MIYFVACLLALLAVGFACWPLFRSRSQGVAEQVQHDDVVRALYRDRVEELNSELQEGALRDEVAQDLGAVLLTEAQQQQLGVESASKRTPFIFLALLLPVLGISTYLMVADPNLDQIRGAEEVLQLKSEDDVALQSWLLRLERRTVEQPDDSKSWYLLAQVYLKLGQYSKAAESFATTAHIAGEDLNIQVYWLQSRYLAAKGVLDEVSHGLAQRILEQQPNLPVVLEILALDAFRQGEGEVAIGLLNRGLSGANDLRQQATFASAIRQVRGSLSSPPPGVSVAISAKPAAPAHSTVFVIARPIGGGMPFAVVKRPSMLLPFEVQLDDLVSMSPARKLSQAEEFEVLVRLSASGKAMASAGDWQWQSQPLSSGDMGVVQLEAELTPPQ